MEQDALLQGRQRVDVLDVGAPRRAPPARSARCAPSPAATNGSISGVICSHPDGIRFGGTSTCPTTSCVTAARQIRQRRTLKHPPDLRRQSHPPQPLQHLHDQQRVPAQLEEVVVAANSLHPQQLLPDPGQDLLDLPLRGLVLPAGSTPPAPGPAVPAGPASRWLSAASAPASRRRSAPCTRAVPASDSARSASALSSAPPRRGLPGHHIRHQALLPGAPTPLAPRAPSRAMTTASWTSSWRASCASISPSSIRKPRIFT